MLLALVNDWHLFLRLGRHVRTTTMCLVAAGGFGLVLLDTTIRFVLNQWVS